MRRTLPTTLTDYVFWMINPLLIMLLLDSFALYLLEAHYDGENKLRLTWALMFFNMGIVACARISLMQGATATELLAVPLIGATIVVIWLLTSGPLLATFLVILLTFLAFRLAKNTTILDQAEESGSLGLVGRVFAGQSRAAKSSPAGEADRPSSAIPPDARRANVGDPDDLDGDGDDDSDDDSDGPTTPLARLRDHLRGKRRPESPGLWVLYVTPFTLLAMGSSSWFLPEGSRTYAHLLLALHLGCALILLATATFLNLRRYLRQRMIQMPESMTGIWVGASTIMLVGALLVAMILPRPALVEPLESDLFADAWWDKQSDWAMPWEGTEGDDSQQKADGKGQPSDAEGSTGSTGSAVDRAADNGGSFEGDAEGGSGGGENAGESGSGGKSSSSDRSSGERKDSDKPSGSAGGKSGSGAGGSSGQGDSGGTGSSGGKSDSGQSGGGGSSGKSSSGQQSSSGKPPSAQPTDQGSSARQASSASDANATPPPPESSDPFDKIIKEQEEHYRGNLERVQRHINWSKLLAGLRQVVMYLFWLAIFLATAYMVWRYRAQIFAAFEQWWRELSQWLANALRWGDPRLSVEGGSQISVIPPRPFRAYVDPFTSGVAAKWNLRDLLAYSQEALDAWSRDRDFPRGSGETPSEFAARLALLREPTTRETVTPFADVYARAAFGPGGAPRETIDVVRSLWKYLSQSTGRFEAGSAATTPDAGGPAPSSAPLRRSVPPPPPAGE